jgi:hypothetical protein
MVIGLLATPASATTPTVPVVPAKLVDLVAYRFDAGDSYDSDKFPDDKGLRNVLEETPEDGDDEDRWLEGRIVSDPEFVAETTGEALQFDGVDDYVEVIGSRHVTFYHGVFVQARVMIDSQTGPFSRGIVTKWYPDQWLLSFDRTLSTFGNLEFTVRLDDGTPAGEYHRIDYPLPSGAYLDDWITVTGIYDPYVGVQLFLNGECVAFDDNHEGRPIVDAFQPIHVGDASNNWSRFDGKIDEVVIWGDFSPVPHDAQPLVHYDFDDGQIAFDQTDNLVAGPGVDWMRGALVGDWELVPTTIPEDNALGINLPDPAKSDDTLGHVEVVRGHSLGFWSGFAVTAKIFLPNPLVEGDWWRVAGRLPADGNALHYGWRLYFGPIDGEGLNLMFDVNFESGSHIFLKFPIPDQDPDPPGHLGRWIDVGASYEPREGLAALYWDHRREVVGRVQVDGRILPAGVLRIGLGDLESTSTAFEGLIDEVRIWGDRSCASLTTSVEPPDAGDVAVTPEFSRLPFCSGELNYTTGEVVGLEATAFGEAFFTNWSGDIDYAEGSESVMYDIDIAMTHNTTATAHFSDSDAPKMELYPVAGCHNISVDPACYPNICGLACGRRARELANQNCHVAGLDIHAELGTPVVAAQTGWLRFRCDRDVQENDPYGGNVAEIVTEDDDDGESGKWRDSRFMYYYAHLDTVCAWNRDGAPDNADAANPCGEDWSPEHEWACEELIPVQRLGESWYSVEKVHTGQVLGLLGRSGNAADRGHHLHFSIGKRYENDDPPMWSCAAFDPFPILYALEDGSCPDTSSGNDFELGDLGDWSVGGD